MSSAMPEAILAELRRMPGNAVRRTGQRPNSLPALAAARARRCSATTVARQRRIPRPPLLSAPRSHAPPALPNQSPVHSTRTGVRRLRREESAVGVGELRRLHVPGVQRSPPRPRRPPLLRPLGPDGLVDGPPDPRHARRRQRRAPVLLPRARRRLPPHREQVQDRGRRPLPRPVRPPPSPHNPRACPPAGSSFSSPLCSACLVLVAGCGPCETDERLRPT